MGQVFMWDAIQHGRIPKTESFHRVASDIRKALVAEPSVACALLFGSVVRGDFNVRSDVDCVFIYKTEQEARALSVAHELDAAALALHVPINFTPCDTVVAGTRLHALGESFVRHLRASIDAGGLIKGDLAELLAPTVPMKQEIEQYISKKMYTIQESLMKMSTFSEERRAAFLKKALEAPMHVARKVLVYNGKLGGDSKKEVHERYRETMPRLLSSQLDFLLVVDRLYGMELLHHFEEVPNQKLYESVVGKLQEQVPRVLEFLRSNALAISDAR